MTKVAQRIIDEPDDEVFRRGVRAWLTEELRRLAGPLFGRAAMHGIEFRRAWEDHV